MDTAKVPELIRRPFLLLRLIVFGKLPLLISAPLLTEMQLSCFCSTS